MESTDSKIQVEEITTTLEQIQRVNQMMAYHKTFSEPDQTARSNFQELRNDFLAQLATLMDAFDLEVRWKNVVYK